MTGAVTCSGTSTSTGNNTSSCVTDKVTGAVTCSGTSTSTGSIDLSGVTSRLDGISSKLDGVSKGIGTATVKSYGDISQPTLGKFYTSTGGYTKNGISASRSVLFGKSVPSGSYYVSDGTKTVSGSMHTAITSVQQTPFVKFLQDVFKISFPSASCPTWTFDGVMGMQSISISPLCDNWMAGVWSVVRAVLKIIASMLALRIAFYTTS